MLLSGSFFVRVSLRARIMPPSLPLTPTASAPARVIRLATCLLTEPASTISTTSTMAASVTRKPVDEGGLDREPLQHGVDLWTAAMHDDRVHAHLLQQSDVAAKLDREVILAHGVAAVLHHDGGAGVATQERQRLRQNARPLGGRSGIAGRSFLGFRSCGACRVARAEGQVRDRLADTGSGRAIGGSKSARGFTPNPHQRLRLWNSATGRALGTRYLSNGPQRLRLWCGSRGQSHQAGFRAEP